MTLDRFQSCHRTGNLDARVCVKKHGMTGPAEELRRILSRIPREAPPEIPLQKLLEQLAAIRRRTVVAVGGLIAAGFLVALTIGERPIEPPVHLNIQVVTDAEAPSPEADSSAGDTPTEFDRP